VCSEYRQVKLKKIVHLPQPLFPLLLLNQSTFGTILSIICIVSSIVYPPYLKSVWTKSSASELSIAWSSACSKLFNHIIQSVAMPNCYLMFCLFRWEKIFVFCILYICHSVGRMSVSEWWETTLANNSV
jgi:hypothetical protein